MRNVIVICANQIDLIRICRYLSYFHGGNLVVFSSKNVFYLFENPFSRMFHHSKLPPQIHVVFQHQRLNFYPCEKRKPNRMECDKELNFCRHPKFPSVSAVKLIFPLHPNNIPLRTGPA